MKRRVARRALLRQKQEEYLRKYRSQVMHKKATRIQSAARAFLARRLVGSWNEAAAVIQGAFRRHLAERRERVRALIHLYYDAHATRIQQEAAAPQGGGGGEGRCGGNPARLQAICRVQEKEEASPGGRQDSGQLQEVEPPQGVQGGESKGREESVCAS